MVLQGTESNEIDSIILYIYIIQKIVSTRSQNSLQPLFKATMQIIFCKTVEEPSRFCFHHFYHHKMGSYSPDLIFGKWKKSQEICWIEELIKDNNIFVDKKFVLETKRYRMIRCLVQDSPILTQSLLFPSHSFSQLTQDLNIKYIYGSPNIQSFQIVLHYLIQLFNHAVEIHRKNRKGINRT